MILKCFNLPFSPQEVVAKKGYGADGPVQEWIFRAILFSAVWKLAVQLTGQQQQFNPLTNTSQSSLVALGQQTQISSSDTIQQRKPGFSHSISQQEGPGPTGIPGKVLLSVLLSSKSEDQRRYKTNKHLAMQASQAQPPSLSAEPYLYPANIMCSPQVLPHHMSLPQLTSLINQPESMEAATNRTHHQKFFWCVSLYGVPTICTNACTYSIYSTHTHTPLRSTNSVT